MTQHDRFLQRLRESRDAVFLVARYLSKWHDVTIPRIKEAPTAAEHLSFVDSGDIILGDGTCIEVKHISKNFTSIDNWPFKEVLVSNKNSVERSNNAKAYFTVSSDMRFAAIVHSKNRDKWYITLKFASNTNNMETYYASPLDLATFVSLED